MRQGKKIFDHFYYTEKDLETLSEEMGDDLVEQRFAGDLIYADFGS